MAPSVPAKHKALVFEEAGKPLALKDVDTPRPKAGEILIKCLATGICHTDAAVGAGFMGPLYAICNFNHYLAHRSP